MTSKPLVRPGSVAVTAGLLLLAGCAGGPGTGATSPAATEAEWRALRTPRPEPLDGAARVTLSTVTLAGPYAWPFQGTVAADLGITELAVAALLDRRDVHFVERRRFSAAAEAERAGLPAPAGQPPVGVSGRLDYRAAAVYTPLPDGRATLEIRLTAAMSGEVASATRVTVEPDASPLALARATVEGIRTALDDIGRLPAGGASAPLSAAGADPDVPDDAVRNFLRGLAYEERWRWEDARIAYETAARTPAFPEARAALARTARLRLGGTLAES